LTERESNVIENNPTNVPAVFEMLLEEIEAEIDFVKGVGSKAFEKRNCDRAKDVLGHADNILRLRTPSGRISKQR